VEKNPRPETGGGKKKTKSKIRVATLQLTPADAEKLALAATEGDILLSLRNQSDHKAAMTKGISLNKLVKGQFGGSPLNLAQAAASIKPEAKPQKKTTLPPIPTVEVIKGVSRTKQKVSK
jgi:pilus assembly protein CpaB